MTHSCTTNGHPNAEDVGVWNRDTGDKHRQDVVFAVSIYIRDFPVVLAPRKPHLQVGQAETGNMKAARVHRIGPPSVIAIETIGIPQPGEGEILVRVAAAGVGPWDALIRTGNSGVPQTYPLTLGSEISGVVEKVGPGVGDFAPGEAIFGATNPSFIDGYAEYAVAKARMTPYVSFHQQRT